MSGIPSTDDRQTPSFSVLYVILGGAALLSAVIIPLAIMFTVRYVRRRSQPPEQQPPGAPGVTTRGNLEQEEPKLFDVYVKPGLEMHEARFEYILPLTVRAASTRCATPVTHALSISPSALRTRYQLRSRRQEVYKEEALIGEDALNAYDVAIFITMPHSHAVDKRDGVGEYFIGTTKLGAAPTSLDNLVPS